MRMRAAKNACQFNEYNFYGSINSAEVQCNYRNLVTKSREILKFVCEIFMFVCNQFAKSHEILMFVCLQKDA